MPGCGRLHTFVTPDFVRGPLRGRRGGCGSGGRGASAGQRVAGLGLPQMRVQGASRWRSGRGDGWTPAQGRGDDRIDATSLSQLRERPPKLNTCQLPTSLSL